MKKFIQRVGITIFLGAASLAFAEAPQYSPRGTWEQYFQGRLRVGLRATAAVQLRDDQRTLDNSFLGTITQLKEKQGYQAIRPFLRYELDPMLQLEMSYEALSTKTGTQEGDSDGTFRLSGPALSLLGRYPNASRYTPGLGLGLIFYESRFDADSRWGNGFPGTESGVAEHQQWIADGKPAWPNNGYQRRIETDSQTLGTSISGSLEIALDQDWHVELFCRYVAASVNAHYTLRSYGNVQSDRGWYTFPHDHTAFGFSLFHRF